ncbi:MAG: hypothetical protein K8W52_28830, partial [Deltaproteobacteria bacterium]|nr:hypothetical protein [Deltaproteobacteria bacterium]
MSRLLLSTVLLAACTSAAPSLTRVTPEPAGAHCATGGSAIATGVDANGNGQLDDAEVDDVAYQCTTQPPVLVREDDEPAGANCADGGTAVRVGHDTNGDGRLDDVEIEQTSYACAPEAIWEGDLTIDLAHDDLTALRDLRVVTGDL